MVSKADLPGFRVVSQGKVRDIFEVTNAGEGTDAGLLLIVCTDRLSAFDVVLPDPIPNKGKVLTQLSAFWFERFADLVPNHVVSTNIADFPPELQRFNDQLSGRSMLVRRAKPLTIECVVRGYLAGSGWKEYGKTGSVCGIKLPSGLHQAEKLPGPIFTPSTKAQAGHDENITQEQAAALVGAETAEKIREVSLNIYERAAEYALDRGIIIADTKFEFGVAGNELVWIDEALTPDSSRFWDVKEYRVGISPPSFDKQFVRDYLERIGWNKTPPAPNLPGEVIIGTSNRYKEAYRKLTGLELG